VGQKTQRDHSEWRKIAISLIGTQKGEGKAHACEMAFYEKVIKVKADVAAYLN